MYGLKTIERMLKDMEYKRIQARKKAYNNKVGYAPKCKVCNSNQLDEIEELRENGYSYEDILEELEITNISIMSLSRHFKNHYPKSQAYKDKQQIEMLENIREAYLQYPFLEEYFKDKDLQYLEEFNKSSGFCTDSFKLCKMLPAGTVGNSYDNINRLGNECNKEIEKENEYGVFTRDEETNNIKVKYNEAVTNCLSCKNVLLEERVNLLEKIITYNFLNITPENKELYFNLLEFDGNQEEFIQQLTEAKEENPAK